MVSRELGRLDESEAAFRRVIALAPDFSNHQSQFTMRLIAGGGRGRTGRSALYQILHDRSLRLAAALIVAVAIPATVIFYFQLRSFAALEATSAGVLTHLGDEAADRVGQALRQDLKAPYFNELQRVSQTSIEQLDFDEMTPILAEAMERHPFLQAFYVWAARAAAPPRGQFLVFRRITPADRTVPEAPASGFGFRQARDDERRLLNEALGLARYKRVFVLPSGTIDGRPYQLGVRLVWESPTRERIVGFLGFGVDVDRFRRDYVPAVVARELAAIETPKNFPPLVIAVLDEAGRTIYQSAAANIDRFAAERTLPFVFVDPDLLEAMKPYQPRVEKWRVRSIYGERTIVELVHAQTARSVGLVAALVLLMAGSVFVAAVAAAREVRLAEMRSNFVASVSHDLKTPLALIQLFAETLELGRAKSAERAQEYYRVINSEARKLTRLIDNILDFSQIEAGLRRYSLEPVDLAALTRRVVGTQQHLFEQNQFSVAVHVHGEVPAVMADPRAVEQALDNLLSNAMKYCRDRKEITVEVGRADGHAYVRVADRGIGIPATQQSKIFQKFYRIEGDGGTGPQGCGLGLAIVDHIMRGHSGSVGVESAPGQGSAFTLLFPIIDGMIPEDRSNEAEESRTQSHTDTEARR